MTLPQTSSFRIGLWMLLASAVFASLALFRRVDAPVVVRVVRAQESDLVTAVTGTGTVQPKRTVDIKYDGQDFVDELAVTEGQTVKRGQMLARMNTQLLQHARAQALQVTERDDANLALAEATMHRSEMLNEHQLIAHADLDSARSAREALLHQREGDRAALLEVDTQIERATLRSPLSGVVTQLYVHQGEMLGSAAAVTSLGSFSAVGKPTNVLMTLAQDGALEVWADINAIDLGHVFTGQRAQISIDAFRPTVFEGRVRQIGLQPTVLNNVTTYQVKIDVLTSDPNWRIGLPVAVMLTKTIAPNTVLVPIAAVTVRDGVDVVRVVNQHECAKGFSDVRVHTLGRNTQSVAVQGIALGDLLVTSGESLASGASYQCQLAEFQPNPTFEDLQFSGAAPQGRAATLLPGPKPTSVLQRFFGM